MGSFSPKATAAACNRLYASNRELEGLFWCFLEREDEFVDGVFVGVVKCAFVVAIVVCVTVCLSVCLRERERGLLNLKYLGGAQRETLRGDGII
jgi:hypothetical protein